MARGLALNSGLHAVGKLPLIKQVPGHSSPYAEFRDAVLGPGQIKLVQAMLAIAHSLDMPNEPAYVAQKLAALAAGAPESCRMNASLDTTAAAVKQATALCHYLHAQQGFVGNHQDYTNPANSNLTQVLQHQTGIPISLAIVYMEVAGALGNCLHGVAFPGHFLLQLGDTGEVFIDPYNGQVFSRAQCRDFYYSLHGSQHTWHDSYLQVVPGLLIIRRVLGNLVNAYREQPDVERLLVCRELLLILGDGSSQDLFQRALALESCGRFDLAISDLRALLSRPLDASFASLVTSKLSALAGKSSPILH